MPDRPDRAEFPRLVSPDDHLVEPPDLWVERLPTSLREAAPRVVRERGSVQLVDGWWRYVAHDDGDAADCWVFEDKKLALNLTAAAAGFELDEMSQRTTTYDEIRPGCFEVGARLADMDLAGIEASLCFPGTFVRFCGQQFLWAKDKELALACVRAYNDFVVEEWAGASGGRLIPLCIVPLWDPQLAADEIRRNAARGVRAAAFSEIPPYLGLPSIHTKQWDVMFDACQDSETILNMHIGSSSRLPTTSEDAPAAVQTAASSVNSALSLLDWLYSGIFVRFPRLRIAFAECQIGWLPYFLERADRVWDHNRAWNEVYDKLPDAPSSYFRDHIYCSFFSDDHGLKNLDTIGPENVMFETDYPHSDSNWPDSRHVAREMVRELPPSQQELVVRENARRLFGLDATHT